jgi:hypothetical protein
MKPLLMALPVVLLTAASASGQTIPEMEIGIEGFQLMATGPEKHAGVSRTTGPIRIGVPVGTVFSMSECGNFSVQPGPNPFPEEADVGWRIDLTAVRMVHHAVTFRLRWTRALDKVQTQASLPSSEEIELTLQPGESRPLDSVPVSPKSATGSGRPCTVKSVSLRVSVNFRTFNRSLVGADVWLVERLPTGKEQSQLQSLRGRPHEPIRFFFDSLAGTRGGVDISGHLVADLDHGGIAIELETIKAVADPGGPGYQSARWFRSRVPVKPDETVEVALPGIGEAKGGLDGRTFSLRIRVKQIR